MRDYFADYSQRLQLEKLVIGLEEPISIKGIGEFVAKVDSGNGGYNVIHGEDVYQNGGVLVFKTYDKNNELKQVSKKLLQYINVNIGSGKVEQRPVIELDVDFGGREYQKIPFSVANRSSNSHKVLICKDFIQNQLDALIDVSGTMLSDQGIEVKYINEDVVPQAAGSNPEVFNAIGKAVASPFKAVGKGLAAVGNAGMSGGRKVMGAARTARKGVNKITNIIPGVKGLKDEIKSKGGFLKSFAAGFQGAGKFTDAAMIGGVDKNVDKAKEYDDLVRADRKAILRRVGASDNDTLVYKLVDYQGKYYNGGNKPTERERANWEEFQSGNKLISSGEAAKFLMQRDEEAAKKAQLAQQQQAKQGATATANPQKVVTDEQEESLVETFEQKAVRMLLEAAALPVNQAAEPKQPAKTTANQTAPQQTDQQSQQNKPEQEDVFLKRYNEISDLYNNKRQRFGVYFVQVGDGIKQETKTYDSEVKSLLHNKKFPLVVDKFFGAIKENKLNFNTKSGNDIINSNRFLELLGYLPTSKLSKKLSTTFAICWGNLSDRKVWLSDADISTSNYSIDALDDFIDKLEKPKDKQIAKDYQRLVYKWRNDPVLQYQNCDLSQADSFTQLYDALMYSNKDKGVNLHLEYIKNEQGIDNNDGLKPITQASQNIVLSIKNKIIDQEKALSPGVWDQLVKYRYKAKPIKDNTKENTNTEDIESNDEINSSGNETIDNILQQANVSYSDLSDEDKLAIAKLFQQRLNKLQKVSKVKESWQKNPVLGNILKQVPYEQIDDNDKAQIMKMIQARISNLQKAA